MNKHDGSRTGDDRLMSLSEAVALVPFSETTPRRAIARGELEAWQPNSGKLVMWRERPDRMGDATACHGRWGIRRED